jgi:hypothetical protein
MNTLAQAEVRRNRLKNNTTRLSPAPDRAICNCWHKRKLAGYPTVISSRKTDSDLRNPHIPNPEPGVLEPQKVRYYRSEVSPMESLSISFGDPAMQQSFAEEYAEFLIEYKELIEVIKTIMLNRVINPSIQDEAEAVAHLEDDDPLVLAVEDKYKANIASFILARLAIDEFSEMLVLASFSEQRVRTGRDENTAEYVRASRDFCLRCAESGGVTCSGRQYMDS